MVWLLVFNGVVLTAVLVMMVVLMRSSAIYNWEIYPTPRKNFHQRRILKLLLASIATAFLAGLINIIFG